MKKTYIVMLIALVSFQSFSQITFEKGYIKTEAGEITSVLIRFKEMINNPSQIQYKLSPEGEVKTADISSIQGFGIGDSFQFSRERVKIDRSSEDLKNLSSGRNPELKEETLFLRILIEGDYTLLSYKNGNFQRFFIRDPKGDVEQLIYKRYNTGDNIVRYNNRYKQQLITLLKCEDISENVMRSVDYTERELIKLFKTYYSCTGNNFKFLERKSPGDLNITIKAAVIFTSFNLEQDVWKIPEDDKYDINPGVGLEVEYVFPMVNNKLSFFSDPSFSMYSAQKEIVVTLPDAGLQDSNVIYKPKVNLEYLIFEIPVGIRFYTFLNKYKNTKLFFHGGASFSFLSNSSKVINPISDEYSDYEFEHSRKPLYFGGIGYKLRDKFSIEARYFPKRPFSENHGFKIDQNNSFSLIAGYTIF